jgi:hypothetical protein
MRKVVSVRSPSSRQRCVNACRAGGRPRGRGRQRRQRRRLGRSRARQGRWAGNTNGSPGNVDALGATAYYDAGSGEAIHGCHRSKASEIGIGGPSANLACSGARTYTQPFSSGSDFKPGLDFYDDGAGHIGQARPLQQYAATHNVKMVVRPHRGQRLRLRRHRPAVRARLAHLALVVEELLPRRLEHDLEVHRRERGRHHHPRAERVPQPAHRDAQRRLRRRSWTLLAQTYSSPLAARRADPLLPERLHAARPSAAAASGTPDADWANDTVVPTLNGTVRNAAAATGMSNIALFDARTRSSGIACARTPTAARGAGARELALRPARPTAPSGSRRSAPRRRCSGPYQLQEDAHPSYWGQLALRNCLRQAYNAAPRAAGPAATRRRARRQGEPNMSFG